MAECVLSLIVAETVQRSTNQDKQGYETGYRFVEQMSERRLGTEPLEVMKFLCIQGTQCRDECVISPVVRTVEKS